MLRIPTLFFAHLVSQTFQKPQHIRAVCRIDNFLSAPLVGYKVGGLERFQMLGNGGLGALYPLDQFAHGFRAGKQRLQNPIPRLIANAFPKRVNFIAQIPHKYISIYLYYIRLVFVVKSMVT